MSLTSKCRHLLIGNQNTIDKNTFTPRLQLPVNARAKNMFSTDVKRLCFRCQTLKFPRPKLKVMWPQTSMFQVSNFEISPHISDFRRFFSYFLDYNDSEPREHWLCRENFTFGRKKFKVWHLRHRRWTSVENMFLARAFTGRCNQRDWVSKSFRSVKHRARHG